MFHIGPLLPFDVADEQRVERKVSILKTFIRLCMYSTGINYRSSDTLEMTLWY